VSPDDADRRALAALQVTTRSPLGAVAAHTGGLLVDGGWLRVLGAGCARLPRAIDRWNGVGGAPRFAGGLLVADDAAGGFFAWFREPRTVHYFAPDTLGWEDTGLGYGAWLEAMCTDTLARFYADLRWDGWEAEVPPDRAAHFHPPLFARAEGPRSRKAVPVEEIWGLQQEWSRQLG
jgi:Protein of unknown function DUF2625